MICWHSSSLYHQTSVWKKIRFDSTRTGFSVSSGAIPQLQIYNCNKQHLLPYSTGSPSVSVKKRFNSRITRCTMLSGAIPRLQIYNCNKQHFVTEQQEEQLDVACCTGWVFVEDIVWEAGDTCSLMKDIGGVSKYVLFSMWRNIVGLGSSWAPSSSS